MDELELPGWNIEVTEQSPGVWRLIARHETGVSFGTAQGDINRAFQSLKEFDTETAGATIPWRPRARGPYSVVATSRASPPTVDSAMPDKDTLDRFSPQALQAVRRAEHEARLLQQGHVGTEHILLGLLRTEDGIASRVLTARGMSLDRARDHMLFAIGRGDCPGDTPLLFSPEANKALGLAVREAEKAGSQHVQAEHLLLAITDDELVSDAMTILLDNEVEQPITDPTAWRASVLERRIPPDSGSPDEPHPV